MPSVFEQALARFGPKYQQRILHAMHGWATTDSIGRPVVHNLEHDKCIPVSSMYALLASILRHSATPSTIIHNFKLKCNRHVLKGSPIKPPLPTVVGRATDREKFVKALTTAYPHIFCGKATVRDFVDRIQKPMCHLTTRESAIAISRTPAFVTWSKVTEDPFDFMKSTRADEVRACLGLKSTRRGGGPYMLLFSYYRGTDDLRFPTVADAGMYEYFLTPPTNCAQHGWTRPWPEEELTHIKDPSGNSVKPEPRPEAVQKAACFDRVTFPVLCLK